MSTVIRNMRVGRALKIGAAKFVIVERRATGVTSLLIISDDLRLQIVRNNTEFAEPRCAKQQEPKSKSTGPQIFGLTIREGWSVLLGHNIKISVSDRSQNQIRLTINLPKDLLVTDIRALDIPDNAIGGISAKTLLAGSPRIQSVEGGCRIL